MNSLTLTALDHAYLCGVFEAKQPTDETLRHSVGILEPDGGEHADGVPLFVYFKNGEPVKRLTVLETANRRSFKLTPD